MQEEFLNVNARVDLQHYTVEAELMAHSEHIGSGGLDKSSEKSQSDVQIEEIRESENQPADVDQDLFEAQQKQIARHIHRRLILFGEFKPESYHHQLSPEFREKLKRFIFPVLSPAGKEFFAEDHDMVPNGSISFGRTDLWIDIRKDFRKDGVFKKVLSIALKFVYKRFQRENLGYLAKKRDEIHRLMFERIFRRRSRIFDSDGAVVALVIKGQKLSDGLRAEHQQMFSYQDGVTKEFMRWSLGLKSKKPNAAWMNQLLDIMLQQADKLTRLYKKKNASMIDRIWSLDSQQTQHKQKLPLPECTFREALFFTRTELHRIMLQVWNEQH